MWLRLQVLKRGQNVGPLTVGSMVDEVERHSDPIAA